MKNGMSKARSSSSKAVATMTAGNAMMTMPQNTSMTQAKIGILSSVMPGARVRRIPTASSMAPAMAEISMKPMPSSHRSAFMAGENCELVRGGYMNQPPSGASPTKMLQKNTSPPTA
ncbi:hypothetical protein D3C71_1437830 [compost metagenome]